jgi:2-succinyl-6-hydroxy-2,4-cyclohexadiene-1-carboxylate synthase
MGGRVALRLGLAEPDLCASLVLVGASPGLAEDDRREERERADEALAARIEGGGLEAFVDEWMAQPLFASQAALGPGYLAEARAQRLRSSPQGLANVLRGMGAGSMTPLWEHLGELRAPSLLVSGALDEKFGAIMDDMHARMPLSRRLVIEGAGHAVHVERPAELAAAVAAFLAAVGGPAQGNASTPGGSAAGGRGQAAARGAAEGLDPFEGGDW